MISWNFSRSFYYYMLAERNHFENILEQLKLAQGFPNELFFEEEKRKIRTSVRNCFQNCQNHDLTTKQNFRRYQHEEVIYINS
ncbi:hypothetical protein HZS_7901 [Henneguya salminicola]|nr:hypothetical protein HZS_7901 [Henneguya salminicola]